MAEYYSENILYKYKFNDIQLIRGNEVLQLSWQNIASLTIYKGFDEYIRPQYVLTLQIDNKTSLWISKYQNDFQVYLDVYKVMTNEAGQQIGPSSQFIRGTFVAVNPTSSSISTDRLTYTDPTIMDNSEVNNLGEMMVDAPVSIGLLQREMYNATMSPCNMIVDKDNLQNVVAAMFTRAGIKRVLMSPFQNSKVYEDLIVPPLPLYRGVQYLDYKYGFHKAGSIVFYDYDTAYVIDTSMRRLVTFERNQDPYITLNIYESTKNIMNGHVQGSRKCELYVSNSVTSILSGDAVTNTSGSTVTNINIDTGEKTDITNETDSQLSFTGKAVVYGTGSPDFIQQRQLENKTRISFAGYHYDFSVFKPNSIVSIYHSNPATQKKVKGKFRITEVMTNIENSGDNFTANSSVSLAYCGE